MAKTEDEPLVPVFRPRPPPQVSVCLSDVFTETLREERTLSFHFAGLVSLDTAKAYEEGKDTAPLRVHTVLLSHNKLRSLEGIERWANVQHVSLAFNPQLSDWSELMRISPAQLRSLSLEGCPVCQTPSFRPRVLARFPHLLVLNGAAVTPQDRSRAVLAAELERHYTSYLVRQAALAKLFKSELEDTNAVSGDDGDPDATSEQSGGSNGDTAGEFPIPAALQWPAMPDAVYLQQQASMAMLSGFLDQYALPESIVLTMDHQLIVARARSWMETKGIVLPGAGTFSPAALPLMYEDNKFLNAAMDYLLRRHAVLVRLRDSYVAKTDAQRCASDDASPGVRLSEQQFDGPALCPRTSSGWQPTRADYDALLQQYHRALTSYSCMNEALDIALQAKPQEWDTLVGMQAGQAGAESFQPCQSVSWDPTSAGVDAAMAQQRSVVSTGAQTDSVGAEASDDAASDDQEPRLTHTQWTRVAELAAAARQRTARDLKLAALSHWLRVSVRPATCTEDVAEVTCLMWQAFHLVDGNMDVDATVLSHSLTGLASFASASWSDQHVAHVAPMPRCLVAQTTPAPAFDAAFAAAPAIDEQYHAACAAATSVVYDILADVLHATTGREDGSSSDESGNEDAQDASRSVWGCDLAELPRVPDEDDAAWVGPHPSRNQLLFRGAAHQAEQRALQRSALRAWHQHAACMSWLRAQVRTVALQQARMRDVLLAWRVAVRVQRRLRLGAARLIVAADRVCASWSRDDETVCRSALHLLFRAACDQDASASVGERLQERQRRQVAKQRVVLLDADLNGEDSMSDGNWADTLVPYVDEGAQAISLADLVVQSAADAGQLPPSRIDQTPTDAPAAVVVSATDVEDVSLDDDDDFDDDDDDDDDGVDIGVGDDGSCGRESATDDNGEDGSAGETVDELSPDDTTTVDPVLLAAQQRFAQWDSDVGGSTSCDDNDGDSGGAIKRHRPLLWREAGDHGGYASSASDSAPVKATRRRQRSAAARRPRPPHKFDWASAFAGVQPAVVDKPARPAAAPSGKDIVVIYPNQHADKLLQPSQHKSGIGDAAVHPTGQPWPPQQQQQHPTSQPWPQQQQQQRPDHINAADNVRRPTEGTSPAASNAAHEPAVQVEPSSDDVRLTGQLDKLRRRTQWSRLAAPQQPVLAPALRREAEARDRPALAKLRRTQQYQSDLEYAKQRVLRERERQAQEERMRQQQLKQQRPGRSARKPAASPKHAGWSTTSSSGTVHDTGAGACADQRFSVPQPQAQPSPQPFWEPVQWEAEQADYSRMLCQPVQPSAQPGQGR